MRPKRKFLFVVMLAVLGICVVYHSLPDTDRIYKIAESTQIRRGVNAAKPIEKDVVAKSTTTEASVPEEKLILSWTTVFDQERPSYSCPDSPPQCHFTNNRSLLSKAHAVILHGDDIRKDDLPERTSYEQRFVFWSMEAPFISPTTERFEGDVLPLDFFNWTMTVSRKSDVHSPYGGYWLAPDVVKEKNLKPDDLHFTYDDFQWSRKKKAIFWLVSNCDTLSKRELAVDRLSKHIAVNITGGCGTGRCEGDCDKEIGGYYFYMALENAVCNDYITEKYWSRYKYPSVPIVMRRRIYENIIPPGSFIAMDDYSSPEAMGQHLNYLTKNRTAYMEYFKWRNDGWKVVYSAEGREGWHMGPCRLCEKLYEKDLERKTYPDV
uniref:Fucosyltransferase n=1 Tax=Steinernema glaseri TaxID=37863 RepID=A0A1I7YXP2_9BILA